MSDPPNEERGFQLVDDPDADPEVLDPEGALPPLTFATFVISLSTSAMVHLGAAADEGGPGEVSLPLAKQTIDILEILSEKTQGNLDDAESRLIEGVLYDLRMRYVDALKAPR